MISIKWTPPSSHNTIARTAQYYIRHDIAYDIGYDIGHDIGYGQDTGYNIIHDIGHKKKNLPSRSSKILATFFVCFKGKVSTTKNHFTLFQNIFFFFFKYILRCSKASNSSRNVKTSFFCVCGGHILWMF